MRAVCDGVRAAADAELALGRREPELVEEDGGQLVVEVLAGVDHAPPRGRARRRGETAAALMNCGRLPMT